MVVLTLGESRLVEAESVNLFAALSGDELDWTGKEVLRTAVYREEAEAGQLVADILRERVALDSDVTVLWGNLQVPSVQGPLAEIEQHLQDIVEVGPQFWIYSHDDRYLVECLVDGRITGGLVE